MTLEQNPLSSEELKEAVDSGRLSLGCPLPAGFTGWTEQDKRDLQDVMRRIIEREREMGNG